MRPSKSDPLLEDLVCQIESGTLPVGARLPTHRELAESKRVSLSVVNRVYGELARRGLVAAGGRRGTVVTFARPSGSPLHRAPVSPAAPDAVIDLSHNYVAFRTLDEAIKSLFASIALSDWDQSRQGSNETLAAQVGRRWLATLGTDASRSAVFGCSGGQHGILASLLAFVGHGGCIAADPFTYTGVKLAAAVLGISIASVPSDRDGMIPAALEKIAKKRAVKAVYLMPSFHNPLGTTMPQTRRAALAEVCQRHDLMVIEDDPHRWLASDETPAFLELLPERCVHVTTMSKVLGPGVRLGFVSADPAHGLRLHAAIRSANWTSPDLETRVVAAALDTVIPNFVTRLRSEAARRQIAARRILKAHKVVASDRAPHICVVLGSKWTSPQLATVALDHGVKISAGASYAVDRSADSDLDFVRVSLMSEMDEARLLGGLRRLSDLLDASPAAFLSAS